MNNPVLWNVTPRGFANTYQCFGRHFHYSALKMQTEGSSETLVVI
jgi:hypothetical protein